MKSFPQSEREMKKSKSALLGSLLLGLLGFTASATASAEEPFPNTTVTIVVPYSPGGGHDFVARLLASRMGPILHQSVIVLNKPGADAMIGAQYVAQSRPDGYTILLGSPSETVIAPYVYKNMQYDPAKALMPVTLASESPIAIVANPSTPVSTLPELFDYAKKNPGKLTYGTPGIGSAHDLAVKWVSQMAGINLPDVPFKGTNDATVAAMSGQIPLASVGFASVMPLWKSGKLKVLAIANGKRVSWEPSIPTVSEQPGMGAVDMQQWMGVFVPANTPASVIATLNKAFVTVLQDPKTRADLVKQGIDPAGNSTADFQKFLSDERSRYKSIVAASHISLR
jgi:tripartite-type tricarboxylate transporter receptor subunit TctC